LFAVSRMVLNGILRDARNDFQPTKHRSSRFHLHTITLHTVDRLTPQVAETDQLAGVLPVELLLGNASSGDGAGVFFLRYPGWC
ncbi:MAG: hypothetical protein ABI876_09685, partial [Bacteroidota bacterium]